MLLPCEPPWVSLDRKAGYKSNKLNVNIGVKKGTFGVIHPIIKIFFNPFSPLACCWTLCIAACWLYRYSFLFLVCTSCDGRRGMLYLVDFNLAHCSTNYTSLEKARQRPVFNTKILVILVWFLVWNGRWWNEFWVPLPVGKRERAGACVLFFVFFP